MLSLFNKPKEEIAAVFDIGNGSIGVSLVQFSSKNIPVLLYTHREPLTFLPQVTSDRLLDSMLNLLESVTLHVQKAGLQKLHHTFLGNYILKDVFCVFSSPWYISQTKVLSIEKEHPFLITKSFIDDLVRTEEQHFNEALKGGEYEKLFNPDTRVLEKKIINTKLNGYEVQHPVGIKAKDLELTLFSSFISTSILKSVESTIRSIIHFKNIQFFSYALVSWSAVRDMFQDVDNFLFMDISGEMTDISITHKGVLLETISFPYGRSTAIRKISQQLTVPPEVALSYVVMKNQGYTEPSFAQKIDEILKEVKQEWQSALIESLQTLGKRYVVPKKLFLTVDADLAKFFINILSEKMPLELTLAQNSFDVVFLNPEKVNIFTHAAPTVPSDSFLALESIFLQKIISL